MRKVLFIVLAIFLLIALIASGVLGYMTYKLNTDLTTSKSEVSALNNQVAQALQACQDKKVSFDDVGMKVAFEYPISWKLVADIGTAQVPPPEPKYVITVVKGDTTLKFTKLLGGVGDIPEGLQAEKHDFVVLNGDKIVRYKLKTSATWLYGAKVSCALAQEIDPQIKVNDTCIEHFFPGFSPTGFATQASLTGADATSLIEADQIVLSAH